MSRTYRMRDVSKRNKKNGKRKQFSDKDIYKRPSKSYRNYGDAVVEERDDFRGRKTAGECIRLASKKAIEDGLAELDNDDKNETNI